MKAASVFLLVATVGTGFLGGIGFVNFMGFGPALKNTPAGHLVRHWQIVDGYMSARMPVFGSIIMLSLIGSGILLAKQSYKQPLWFIIIAFLFILADLLVATKYNFPFNRLIQSITPETIPGNFEYYRNQSVIGFSIRSVCMIGSFVSTLTALFLYVSRLQR
ncbi:MAG TPA: hypothetical protein VJU78_00995 [Chitinophagaceae bacterium]|nr:hypothetical protein [Chitinophagaceae bacterium]